MTNSHADTPHAMTYRDARTALRAQTVLDAVKELITETDWANLSVSDVAKRCGLSRQTIYKEFGSRTGLMNAYILRLASTVITEAAAHESSPDVFETFKAGFERYFTTVVADPLVRNVLGESNSRELVVRITTHGEQFIEIAAQNLARIYRERWPEIGNLADTLATGVVRVSLSYLATPPADSTDAAETLAQLFTPYVYWARTQASEI
ncbi:TetR family transcriptional regulator [Smaragdicoccus niigatensis]|uniref:TetR family transcriptional regulator n=1 Tax=Smaragdicoccus niigatensis TaxID=359359 RepID=UPI0003AA0C46|nr:TetR family transcriptional regulator [Smaragdicoccus niigatensis]